jgi:hypothetical protein
MARMVRWTVGTATAAGAFVEDDVETVVVVTVCVVVVDDGDWEYGDWADSVCRHNSAAVAKEAKARDSLFTVVLLDLGEIEISNHLYGAGLVEECKVQEGMGLW